MASDIDKIRGRRLHLMHGAPSFINHQVEAGHKKLICYVHAGSMFEVLCHAKFNMPYGTELSIIEPDPVAFDRIKNNRGLAINPDLCFDMDPTEFTEMFYSENPKENVLFDGVFINGMFPTAISDVLSMWEHVKFGGKLVLAAPAATIGSGPNGLTGMTPEDEELVGALLDFYHEYEAIYTGDYAMPVTFYNEAEFAGTGDPFILTFLKKPGVTETFGAPTPAADRKRVIMNVK